MGTGVHRNNFDGLRLVAALAVMFSHVFALSGRQQPMLYGDLNLGTYAVYVFFAISGFLVSQSWRSDPDVRRFLARRFLRIAPAYMVVIALTELALDAAMYTDFLNNPLREVNGALWTITREIQCYLFFMVIAMFTRHAALAMIGLYLLIGFNTFFWQFSCFFALGAVISTYAILQRPAALAAMVVAGLGFGLAGQGLWAVLFVVVPLSVYVGISSWPVMRDAGRYGDLSYGIYLVGYPLQQFVIAVVGWDRPWYELLPPALLLTVAWAWLSWRYIEAPALSAKRFLPRLQTSCDGVRAQARDADGRTIDRNLVDDSVPVVGAADILADTK